MQLILLIIALIYSLASPASSAPVKVWSCSDPSTRAAVKAAVQAKFTALGLPRDLEVLNLLSGLRDAQSDAAKAVAALVERKAGLPAADVTLCEVADPQFDAPLFITVLYVAPASGRSGGMVANFGVPGAVAEFGDRLDDR